MPAVAGAAAGATGAAVMTSAALSAPDSPTPAPTRGAVSGLPNQSREIPSLSAKDVAGVAPTNVALEKSLEASTSDADKLNVAMLEIERLKGQLGEAQGPTVTGLRKRGGAGTDAAGAKTTTAVASQTSPQGVPLEICAGLVFAVFVLTYLFF